jgi:hypothetical protein
MRNKSIFEEVDAMILQRNLSNDLPFDVMVRGTGKEHEWIIEITNNLKGLCYDECVKILASVLTYDDIVNKK